MFLLILWAMFGESISGVAPEGTKPPFAGIVFRAMPVATKIRIELATKGDNAYCVTIWADGKTPEDVAASVAKELRKRHWAVENKQGSSLLSISGFQNDGEIESITGLTMTLVASDARNLPLFPSIGRAPAAIKCKLLIQVDPLAREEK